MRGDRRGVRQHPPTRARCCWVTTLAGEELGRLPFERQGDDALAFTPTPLRNLSQHRLEPILLDDASHAAPAPSVAYGHEWEGAEQDADGVTSRVRDRASGAVYEVRSRWLLAADGAAQPGPQVARHRADRSGPRCRASS